MIFLDSSQKGIRVFEVKEHKFIDSDGYEKVRLGDNPNAIVSWADPSQWANLATKSIIRSSL